MGPLQREERRGRNTEELQDNFRYKARQEKLKMFDFMDNLATMETLHETRWISATTVDSGRLQGEWTATAAECNGRPATDIIGHQLSFHGSRFDVRDADGRCLHHGTFRKDPTQEPPAIDFHHTKGSLTGSTWKGIFQRNGETLKICDNAADPRQERPMQFKSSPACVNIIFHRAK